MKIILLICLFPLFVFGGGAINFDGVDDYILMPELFASDPTEFTLSIWAKVNDLSSMKQLFSYVDQGMTPLIRYNRVTSGDISCYLPDGSAWITTSAYDTTNWLCLTFTGKENNESSLYINGNLIDSISTGDFHEIGKDGEGRIIGGSRNVPVAIANIFNGSIGEVMIYNKVLSPEEIKAIYASENAWYPKAGLVGCWSMGNNGNSTGQPHANGSTIKDSFGSNNGITGDGSDNSMTLESSPTRTKRGRR